MEKIKVCHILSGLGAGGVESVVYNYCAHMDHQKYEWHLLYQHTPSPKNILEFQNLAFHLKQVSYKVKHPLKNYRETYKYLKDNQIDVVHCHMTLMNFIPLIAAKKLGIKCRISHSHNSDVRKKGKVVKCLEKIFKKLCIKNATILMACGNDAGKYMYGDQDYIILPNALDLKKFEYNESSRKKIRNNYGIFENKIVIGHIGRFTIQKNHEFLINVFEKVVRTNDNIVLLLVGDGELNNEIKSIVKQKGLDELVIFTGIVDNPYEFYSAFDIFVLPSLWEGLPVVGVEAQAAGLQCLLADNIDTNVTIIPANVKKLKLNEEEWVKEIAEQLKLPKTRQINETEFTKKHLNIVNEVHILEGIYNK